DDELQAGIQVRSVAPGKIAGNVITDHAFIGAQGVPQSAVGIFLVYATPTSNPFLIRDNVFANNQVGALEPVVRLARALGECAELRHRQARVDARIAEVAGERLGAQ